MTSELNTQHTKSEAKCEVCEIQMTRVEWVTQQVQKKEHLLCRSMRCRQVMTDKAILPANIFAGHLKSQRKLIQNRRVVRTEKKQYEDNIRKKESRENRSVLQKILKAQTKFSSRAPLLMSLPTSASKLKKVSERRRSSYRKHLQSVIGEAFADTPAVDNFDKAQSSLDKIAATESKFAKNDALKTLSENLCASCKGGCCADAKENAYLSAMTMVRVKESLPDHSAEQILGEYMSRVNDFSVENTCINQGASGCALPRELRSETCNAFFCDHILDIHKAIGDGPTVPPVVAVKRSNGCWSRFDDSFENEIVDVIVYDKGDVQSLYLDLIDPLTDC